MRKDIGIFKEKYSYQSCPSVSNLVLHSMAREPLSTEDLLVSQGVFSGSQFTLSIRIGGHNECYRRLHWLTFFASHSTRQSSSTQRNTN